MSRRNLDSFGIQQGQTTVSCKYENESAWYSRGEECLYHFRECQLLGKDSVAWNEPNKKKNCTCVQTIFVCNTFVYLKITASTQKRRNNIEHENSEIK
jgi:hypothetical protein